MKTKKQLRVWMDHSTANIIELSNGEVTTVTLDSTPAFPEQIENLRMDQDWRTIKCKMNSMTFLKS